MRKRSKYRPKGVFTNPLAYVLESMTPVGKHNSYLLDLKIKNHSAMTNLTRGIANNDDMQTIICMCNVTEALLRMNFGREYSDLAPAGLDAVHAVGRRGVETGKFILRPDEMNAINNLMELHDAQMEVITVKDMEVALKLVDEEYRLRRMRPIVERKKKLEAA